MNNNSAVVVGRSAGANQSRYRRSSSGRSSLAVVGGSVGTVGPMETRRSARLRSFQR